MLQLCSKEAVLPHPAPRTSAWTRVASPSTDRFGSGLVALYDGSALAVGGSGPDPTSTALASCEIYR